MTCDRCNGLMVSERIYDFQGMSVDLCVDGYRCLICGNLVDSVILENRSRSTDAVGSLAWTSPRPPRLVAA